VAKEVEVVALLVSMATVAFELQSRTRGTSSTSASRNVENRADLTTSSKLQADRAQYGRPTIDFVYAADRCLWRRQASPSPPHGAKTILTTIFLQTKYQQLSSIRAIRASAQVSQEKILPNPTLIPITAFQTLANSRSATMRSITLLPVWIFEIPCQRRE
jgi:hypothetical protein